MLSKGQPVIEPTEPIEPAQDSRIVEAAITGNGLAEARGAVAMRALTKYTRIPAPSRVLGISHSSYSAPQTHITFSIFLLDQFVFELKFLPLAASLFLYLVSEQREAIPFSGLPCPISPIVSQQTSSHGTSPPPRTPHIPLGRGGHPWRHRPKREVGRFAQRVAVAYSSVPWRFWIGNFMKEDLYHLTAF